MNLVRSYVIWKAFSACDVPPSRFFVESVVVGEGGISLIHLPGFQAFGSGSLSAFLCFFRVDDVGCLWLCCSGDFLGDSCSARCDYFSRHVDVDSVFVCRMGCKCWPVGMVGIANVFDVGR